MSDGPQRPTSEAAEASRQLNDARETPDIHYLHAPIMREQAEPRDGREPVPLWLTMFYGIVVFWAGYYLASYNGGFRPDVYDEQRPPAGQAAVADQGDPDPAVQGKRLFTVNCAACHQQSGQGVAGQFPPLVESEWVTGEPAVLIRIVLHGLQGPLNVAGQSYNGSMPAFGAKLDDEQLSLVLTYIRQSWGNQAGEISAEWIAQVRENEQQRTTSWTAEELQAVTPEPPPEPPANEPTDEPTDEPADAGETDPKTSEAETSDESDAGEAKEPTGESP